MVDETSPIKDKEAGGDKVEEGEGEQKEEKLTYCQKIGQCIIKTWLGFGHCMKNVCHQSLHCIGFVSYPIKEGCVRCYDQCQRKRHPWMDPGYHTI